MTATPRKIQLPGNHHVLSDGKTTEFSTRGPVDELVNPDHFDWRVPDTLTRQCRLSLACVDVKPLLESLPTQLWLVSSPPTLNNTPKTTKNHKCWFVQLHGQFSNHQLILHTLVFPRKEDATVESAPYESGLRNL